MIRKSIAYLLILLLYSALLDDALATVMVDPLDGVLAAENNEYLPSLSRQPLKGKAATDRTLPAVLVAVDTHLSATAPSRGLVRRVPPVPFAGPPLLYLFMSLQR